MGYSHEMKYHAKPYSIKDDNMERPIKKNAVLNLKGDDFYEYTHHVWRPSGAAFTACYHWRGIARVVVYGAEEGKFHHYRQPHHHRRRHYKWGRGLSGVLLLALAISLLWLTFLVQTYLGLTGDIQVAQVRATQITGVSHTMSVELILYDQSGHQTS